MRREIWVWGLIVAALAGPSARAAVITNPDWAEKPSMETMAEAYPKLASMLWIEGEVVLSCVISAKGSAEDCRVVYDSPPGLGFGEAGLEVSKSFKFKPKAIDGRAVAGGTVRVPLHFKLPPIRAVETAAAATRSDEVFGPPSPKALALAHRIVAAQALSQRAGLQFEVGLLPLADAKWAGVADKIRDDGLEAMRAGFAAYSADMEGSIARAYASNFTEAELADIAAFVDTPSGHAFVARLQKVSEDIHPPDNPSEVITAAAHKAFCATHPCVLVPPPSVLPDPHAETPPKP